MSLISNSYLPLSSPPVSYFYKLSIISLLYYIKAAVTK